MAWESEVDELVDRLEQSFRRALAPLRTSRRLPADALEDPLRVLAECRRQWASQGFAPKRATVLFALVQSEIEKASDLYAAKDRIAIRKIAARLRSAILGSLVEVGRKHGERPGPGSTPQ